MFGDDCFELPPSEPDPDKKFNPDKHVNTATIDKYVELEGVEYVDVRMLFDTARFDQIGGQQNLLQTIVGFKVVPWPYIGTLAPMPVGETYEGDTLFSIEWSEDGEVISAKPNYEESEAWLADLFPRDRKILILCGAGGYSAQLRKLLLHFGWNPEDVYNVGGAWKYRGRCGVPVVDREGDNATADLTGIEYIAPDFDLLHRL